MKSAVLFGFCLVVALVVESFGEENDYRMRKVFFNFFKLRCKHIFVYDEVVKLEN